MEELFNLICISQKDRNKVLADHFIEKLYFILGNFEMKLFVAFELNLQLHKVYHKKTKSVTFLGHELS